MPNINVATLQQVCRFAPAKRLQPIIDPLRAAMAEAGILDNLERSAHFIGQIAHESGEFNYMAEIASGAAYEGRLDLGNDQPGDGRKHKGYGWIQVTGKKNQYLCADGLGVPRDQIVAYLQTIEGASRASAWFWTTGAGLNLSKRAIAAGCEPGCNLNDYADQNRGDLITLAINGGTNGEKERIMYTERAARAFA